MNTIQETLQAVSGGHVLDVATGRGTFIGYLIEHLKDYASFTGIDSSQRAVDAAGEQFTSKDVHFEQMDAENMRFVDSTFDTVSIAYSLHHMADLDTCLKEMMRVLKPGGHLIIYEMFRDNQTEEQMSHVRMHHWSAEIDRDMGITHNLTFKKDEILAIIRGMPLENLQVFEEKDLTYDPLDEELINIQQSVVDMVLKRAVSLPLYDRYVEQGGLIKDRLTRVGIHGATVVVAIGRKPANLSSWEM